MARKRKETDGRSSSRSKYGKFKTDPEPDPSLKTPPQQEAGTPGIQPTETLQDKGFPLCEDAQPSSWMASADNPDDLKGPSPLANITAVIPCRQEDPNPTHATHHSVALEESVADATRSPVLEVAAECTPCDTSIKFCEFSTDDQCPVVTDPLLTRTCDPSHLTREEDGQSPDSSTSKTLGDWAVEETVRGHETPADNPDDLQDSSLLPPTTVPSPHRQKGPNFTIVADSSAMLEKLVPHNADSAVTEVAAECSPCNISIKLSNAGDQGPTVTDTLLTTTYVPPDLTEEGNGQLIDISERRMWGDCAAEEAAWDQELICKSGDGKEASPGDPYTLLSMEEKDGSLQEKEPKPHVHECQGDNAEDLYYADPKTDAQVQIDTRSLTYLPHLTDEDPQTIAAPPSVTQTEYSPLGGFSLHLAEPETSSRAADLADGHLLGALEESLAQLHQVTGQAISSSAVTTPAVGPVVSDPALHPVVSDPAVHPVVSDPAVNPVVSDPAVNPVVSDPAVNPVVSDPAVNPVFSDPADNPVVSDPAVNPVVSDPSVNPVVSDPSVNPVVSDPAVNPVVSDPAVNPVVNDPAVKKVVTISVVISPVTSTSHSQGTPRHTALHPALPVDAPSTATLRRQGARRGEDATCTVRGLILELSNLNRLIMTTYRELRNKRTRLPPGRSTAGKRRRQDI